MVDPKTSRQQQLVSQAVSAEDAVQRRLAQVEAHQQRRRAALRATRVRRMQLTEVLDGIDSAFGNDTRRNGSDRS